MEKDMTSNEAKFKNDDRELSRAIAAAQQETRTLKGHISDNNVKIMELDRELHLKRGELITLEDKLGDLERSGASAREGRDVLKKAVAAEKNVQDKILSDLSAELEAARVHENSSLDKRAKAKNEENRLIILKDVLEKDAKDKEKVLRGNSSDYSAKLKSLQKKICEFLKIEVDLRGECETAKCKVSEQEKGISDKESVLKKQEEEEEIARRQIAEGKAKLQQLRGKTQDDEKEALAIKERIQKSKKDFEDEKSRLDNAEDEQRKLIAKYDKDIETFAVVIRQHTDRQTAAEKYLAEKQTATQQQEELNKTKAVRQTQELAEMEEAADAIGRKIGSVKADHAKVLIQNDELRKEIADWGGRTRGLEAIKLETITPELKSKLLPSKKIKEIKARVQKSIESDKSQEDNLDKEIVEVQKSRDSFESGKDDLMAKAKAKNAEDMKKIEETSQENLRAIAKENERPAASQRKKDEIEVKLASTEAEIEKLNQEAEASEKEEATCNVERKRIELEIVKNEEQKQFDAAAKATAESEAERMRAESEAATIKLEKTQREVKAKAEAEAERMRAESEAAAKKLEKTQREANAKAEAEAERVRAESEAAAKKKEKKQREDNAKAEAEAERVRSESEAAAKNIEKEQREDIAKAAAETERVCAESDAAAKKIEKKLHEDTADAEVEAERVRAELEAVARKLEKRQRKEAARAAAAVAAKAAAEEEAERAYANAIALKKLEKKARKSDAAAKSHKKASLSQSSQPEGDYSYGGSGGSDVDEGFNFDEEETFDLFEEGGGSGRKKISTKSTSKGIGKSSSVAAPHAILGDSIGDNDDGRFEEKTKRTASSNKLATKSNVSKKTPPESSQRKALPVLVPFDDESASFAPTAKKPSTKEERRRQEEKAARGVSRSRSPPSSSSANKTKANAKPAKAAAQETDWLFGMDDFSF